VGTELYNVTFFFITLKFHNFISTPSSSSFLLSFLFSLYLSLISLPLSNRNPSVSIFLYICLSFSLHQLMYIDSSRFYSFILSQLKSVVWGSYILLKLLRFTLFLLLKNSALSESCVFVYSRWTQDHIFIIWILMHVYFEEKKCSWYFVILIWDRRGKEKEGVCLQDTIMW